MLERREALEILLVEDDPGDARLAAEALKECAVRSHLSVVQDGVEAVAYLRACCTGENPLRPDIVLLDLNLPRKDGREVLAEVKNDPALRRIPIVVLTTSQAEPDILRSYDLHANCFISKPVDLDEFIAVVKSITDFWGCVAKLPRS